MTAVRKSLDKNYTWETGREIATMERDLTERISARIIKSNSIAKISASLDKLLHRCLGAPAMRRFKVFSERNRDWPSIASDADRYTDRSVDFNDPS